MNSVGAIFPRDDVVHGRSDDAAPLGEDLHPKADADPSDFEEAPAHAGAAESGFGERGKEMTAFDQDLVAG